MKMVSLILKAHKYAHLKQSTIVYLACQQMCALNVCTALAHNIICVIINLLFHLIALYLGWLELKKNKNCLFWNYTYEFQTARNTCENKHFTKQKTKFLWPCIPLKLIQFYFVPRIALLMLDLRNKCCFISFIFVGKNGTALHTDEEEKPEKTALPTNITTTPTKTTPNDIHVKSQQQLSYAFGLNHLHYLNKFLYLFGLRMFGQVFMNVGYNL